MRPILQIREINPFQNSMFSGIENWSRAFNELCESFILYLKFLLVFIIIVIGILTIYKCRGFWRNVKVITSVTNNSDEGFLTNIKEPHVILGIAYIAIGFGILFNYFIFFLIWISEPLPDGYIFDLISLTESEGLNIKSLSDIKNMSSPYEKSIYYVISLVSYMGFINLILGIHYIFVRSDKDHKISFSLIFSGLLIGLLFGFTTFLPLFL